MWYLQLFICDLCIVITNAHFCCNADCLTASRLPSFFAVSSPSQRRHFRVLIERAFLYYVYYLSRSFWSNCAIISNFENLELKREKLKRILKLSNLDHDMITLVSKVICLYFFSFSILIFKEAHRQFNLKITARTLHKGIASEISMLFMLNYFLFLWNILLGIILIKRWQT